MNDSAGEGRRRREESLERRQMQEPETERLRPKRKVVQEREKRRNRGFKGERIGGWHFQRRMDRWPQGGGGQSPLPRRTGATPSLRIGPEELARQASGEGAPRATGEPPRGSAGKHQPVNQKIYSHLRLAC